MNVPLPGLDGGTVNSTERSDTPCRLYEIRKPVLQVVEAVQHHATALQVQVQKTVLPDHIQKLEQNTDSSPWRIVSCHMRQA